ncbi:lipoprotein [Spiroplasma endosymbiont of Seladonia tumulorum]|uniref:lipoprotein n=1 Tax=Spiroplasma endosymbiont of Seladonia tumulorum TaxID=3066321 RepID=UPI0030D4EC01
MKKILSLLGTITLIGTSTTSLVACNTPQEYTTKELKELKEKNKINTVNQEIRENLEWITPQEKPFNEVDNKYYYVVWKGNNQLNINKFKNDEFPKQIIPNNNGKDKILINYGDSIVGKQRQKELYFVYRNSLKIKYWSEDNGEYFKLVYRWNLLDKPSPDLVIDENGDVKVKGE